MKKLLSWREIGPKQPERWGGKSENLAFLNSERSQTDMETEHLCYSHPHRTSMKIVIFVKSQMHWWHLVKYCYEVTNIVLLFLFSIHLKRKQSLLTGGLMIRAKLSKSRAPSQQGDVCTILHTTATANVVSCLPYFPCFLGSFCSLESFCRSQSNINHPTFLY